MVQRPRPWRTSIAVEAAAPLQLLISIDIAVPWRTSIAVDAGAMSIAASTRPLGESERRGNERALD